MSEKVVEMLNEVRSAILSLDGDRDWGFNSAMMVEDALATARAIEVAVGEIQRLREVLKNIAHFEPDRNSWSVKQARAALEAKP